MINRKVDNKGYVALITVLIISALGLAIAISLLLIGIGASQTSFVLEQSNQARSLANTCSEEALERIRRNSTYTGSTSLTLTYGNCSYTVIDLGGTDREIQSTGTVDTVVRKEQVFLDQVAPVNITLWQDVADF